MILNADRCTNASNHFRNDKVAERQIAGFKSLIPDITKELAGYTDSVSPGSACSSKKLKASHVLLEIGLEPAEAHGSLRLSLGRMSTKEDVNYVANALPGIVNKLRNMSPLWNR